MLESAAKCSTSCLLGSGNPQVFPRLPAGIVGRFHLDGRIDFEERPRKSWDFMATGTGTTGVTVNAVSSIQMRINHAAAYDEQGIQRALGVLSLRGWRLQSKLNNHQESISGQNIPEGITQPPGIEWHSTEDPFLVVDDLRMTHDLRRSCIQITAGSSSGAVTLTIRAHVDLDVICIEVIDERASQRSLPESFALDLDCACEKTVTEDGVHLFWHVNPSSIYPSAIQASGFIMNESTDPLRGRCFGLAIYSDGGRDGGDSDNSVYRLWVVADSDRDGFGAWHERVIERIRKAVSLHRDQFINSHEQWWSDFWLRSYFEPQPGADDKRFIKQKASFDLYRYYVACCSSYRREFPVRFMNEIGRASCRERV